MAAGTHDYISAVARVSGKFKDIDYDEYNNGTGTYDGASAWDLRYVSGVFAAKTTDVDNPGFSFESSAASGLFYNVSAGVGLVSDVAISINSSGGAINVGNDAVAQDINIGTGAAARTITVGNQTTNTLLSLQSGGDLTGAAVGGKVAFTATNPDGGKSGFSATEGSTDVDVEINFTATNNGTPSAGTNAAAMTFSVSSYGGASNQEGVFTFSDQQLSDASNWTNAFKISEYNASNEWDALYTAFGSQERTLVGGLVYLQGLIATESLWDKAGSVLSPQTAGDQVSIPGIDETASLLSVVQTPTAAAPTNTVATFQAQGTNWGAGSRVVEIISDDTDAVPLTVNDGSSDKFYVTRIGNIYVAGTATVDGNISLTAGGSITTTSSGNLTLSPDGYVESTKRVDINLGADNSQNFRLLRNVSTYFATAPFADDGVHFGIGNGAAQANRNLIFLDYANIADDYNHTGQSANPTVFVHSATAAATATDQWISLSHDQTDGVIATGTGTVEFTSGLRVAAGTNLIFQGTLGNYGGFYRVADDGLHFVVGNGDGTGNRNVILVDSANYTDNYLHSTRSADPTLFIHSATAAATATDQWISFAHDQTNGVIAVGTGVVSFASNAQFTGTLRIQDDVALAIGSGTTDTIIDWSTAQLTAETLVWGMGSASRSVLFTDNTNINKDHHVPAQADPALFIFAVDDVDVDATKYIQIHHNGTDGVITTGAGKLVLTPATNIQFTTATIHPTDVSATFGTGSETSIQFDGSESVADCLKIGVDTTSRNLILVEAADISTNLARAASSTPTFWIHSDDATTATEWINFTHNGTDGVIATGAGDLSLVPTGIVKTAKNINISGADGFLYGATTTGAFMVANSSQTNDAMFLCTGTSNNHIVVCEYADAVAAFDFQHGVAGDPRFYIHSRNQSTTEWLGLYHDQTDAVIASGVGDLKLDAINDVNIPTGLKLNTTTVSAATYTVDTSDRDLVLLVTRTASGTCTITLPSAAAVDGRLVVVKDAGLNAATYNITIDTASTEEIDGSSEAVLNADGASLTLISDGTDWFLI